MKLTKTIIIITIIAGIFSTSRVLSQPEGSKPALTHNQIAGAVYLQTDAGKLKGTIVTPYMQQKILPCKNVLWCSTFQLAWNELYGLNGGPVKLTPASPMADILNKCSASKADIDDASYIAMAGFIEDGALKQIRDELSRKFYGQASPDLMNIFAYTRGFIAYGYLFKTLPFAWKFQHFDESLTFQNKKVQSFGIGQYLPKDNPNQAKMAEQLSIIDFRNKDDFIIELKTQEKDEHLILAKVSPQSTLEQTVRVVQKRIGKSKPTKLTSLSSLFVPVLDFDLLRSFTELEEHTIKSQNRRLDGQPMDVAKQSIRFRLDETGAVLKSEAMMGVLSVSIGMAFDKPYLVFLQRKGTRNPYFALWVGNTELLVPAPIKKKRFGK